ncbi:hypothetical protein [Chromobacterium haemolyticum]|uniref:hypothetical protein n=1 Tax=Chromobacterium haemolyticum TaxID=394935 RepID=UPI0011785585|nr:hypothetical protein [Chromobacterium haemolyticum]
MSVRNEDVICCDFCGKSQHYFVAGAGFTPSPLGNNLGICDTCVEAAMLTILQERLGIDAKKDEDA